MDSELLRPALGTAVFLLMLVVGMDCTTRDFRLSAKRPFMIMAVTMTQFLCIPLVFFAVIQLCSLPAAAATGMLLIGACPSGTISNGFTFLAKGSTSLSVALTTVSNVTGLIGTPLVLLALTKVVPQEIATGLDSPPWALLKQLLVSMLLPLLIGFLLRRRFQEGIVGRMKVIRMICTLLILFVVLLIILGDPAGVWSSICQLAVPVLCATPLLFGLAWLVSRFFKLDRPQATAVLFELPCRNVALAMLISLSILGRRDIVSGMMAFFVIESLVVLILAGIIHRGRAPQVAA